MSQRHEQNKNEILDGDLAQVERLTCWDDEDGEEICKNAEEDSDMGGEALAQEEESQEEECWTEENGDEVCTKKECSTDYYGDEYCCWSNANGNEECEYVYKVAEDEDQLAQVERLTCWDDEDGEEICKNVEEDSDEGGEALAQVESLTPYYKTCWNDKNGVEICTNAEEDSDFTD